MNLRKITLKYMGWCPGVDRAARFFPDYEIPLKPSILLVGFVAIIAMYLAVQPSFYAQYPPYEEGPLKVYVGPTTDRKVIYDRDFNSTFDYFQLYKYGWAGPAYFVEKPDDSEYATTQKQTEFIYFNSLEELIEYITNDLKSPNVVLGLTRSLLEHTWEQFAVKTGYPSTENGASEIDLGMVYSTVSPSSTSRGWGINYRVLRLKDVHLVLEDMDVQDGLIIGKFLGEKIIWEIRIDAGEVYWKDLFHIENPRYKVQVIHYPPGIKLVAWPW